jgi:hypothetical protein
MVVVLENRSYDDVIGRADARYVNELAAQHGLATRAYATGHPSLPNYLELIAGTTFGISSNCTDCSVDGPTIADQLAARSIEWRAYMEDAPSACFTGAENGGYAKRHNPFVYISHIRDDRQACSRILPFSAFGDDLASERLAPFVWITPNLCHDGHDCDNATVDAFLRSVIPPVLASAWYAANGVVIITWDEADGGDSSGCCHGAAGGHVPVIVLSAAGRPGLQLDTQVAHAGILRTVEQLYGVEPLADAADPASGDLLPLIRS